MSSLANIDVRVLDALCCSDSKTLDTFLLDLINYLKKSYAVAGDPRLIVFAASGIATSISELPSSRTSFQYAKLLAFMSEMLLAEGKDVATLKRAIGHAIEATEILLRLNALSQEIIAAHISLCLHLAVLQKALGYIDNAISTVQHGRRFVVEKLNATGVDSIMLDRQEVIMRQDFRSYQEMAEDAVAYAKIRPIEYFATVKRVLEFTMNNGRMDEARRILPEFQRAFRSIRQKLALISHVSFAKNLGQFLLYDGNLQMAHAVLGESLRHARALNLHGQERQISILMSDAGPNTRHGLVTFRVS